MRYYPVFHDMQGASVVFLGGGAGLANKIRLLGKTPAAKLLIAPEIDPTVRFLVDEGSVTYLERKPTARDLEQAALIFIDSEIDAERSELIALARASSALVNVVDRTADCDFITPALVERGPLTLAISSDAKAPALSRHIKAKLERELPPSIGAIGQLVDAARPQLKEALPNPDARRRFLDRLFAGELGDIRSPVQLIAQMQVFKQAEAPCGRIAIVGAGPGDPELLTLKAHRLLQQADVIVYDKLVSDGILDLARRDADRIYVGKSRANHSMPQEDICQLLIDLAREGKFVVRLKGGDPFIFGRGGEEMDAAQAAGIETEIVPGISAALGCAAQAGIPLTHRDHASAVTLVAGQRRDLGKQNWQGLAGPGRTLVVYMGLAAAPDIARKLRSDGLPKTTPVAILENGTRDDGRTLRTTLDAMADVIAAKDVKSPALLVIGDVAAEDRAALLKDQTAQVLPLLREAV